MKLNNILVVIYNIYFINYDISCTVVHGEGLLRRRLLEMGLTPKTVVKVRKVAPMKDPIELYLRSYVLTIRKDDASMIEVEVIDNGN